MSEKDVEPRPGRRVAGVVLGGLAAGAVLGAAVAAEPALAADGGTAVVAADPDAQRPAGQSLKDQFRQAFTPGALVDAPIEIAHIMIPPC